MINCSFLLGIHLYYQSSVGCISHFLFTSFFLLEKDSFIEWERLQKQGEAPFAHCRYEK